MTCPTTVEQIMSTRLITAGMDDTLAGIRKVFELHDCHHIPIVQGDRLAGIVSDRDVLRALSPTAESEHADEAARKSLQKKAHQIMTRRVVTISPEDSIEFAVKLMLERRFSCLPVMGRTGRLVGMVTKTDLLRSLSKAYKQLLQAAQPAEA